MLNKVATGADLWGELNCLLARKFMLMIITLIVVGLHCTYQ